MAWTTPRTWVTGELVTAALLNTHLRDNLLALYSRTIKFFVGAQLSEISGSVTKTHQGNGVPLPDGASVGVVHGGFMVPNNFASDMTVTPVIVGPTSGSTGNLVLNNDAEWFADGEVYTAAGSSSGDVTVATPANNTAKVLTTLALSLTGAAAGDIVSLDFTRDGLNASDTFTAANIYFVGWIVEYTAAG